MVEGIKKIVDSDRDSLQFKGKKATLILALSNTETAEIDGITQAGLPGLIYLTPTLDAEFVATGEIFSLEEIPQTSGGVPTPALITRAIYLMKSFTCIEFLDLGLKVKPKIINIIHSFGLKPSGNIIFGANIDAKDVFQKGIEFAKSYNLYSDYIILGESVPAGTTTAATTALALGYDAKDLFSSSFKNVPKSLKEDTINKAMKIIEGVDDTFERLGAVSDNMILFNAGFLIGSMGRFDVVLAGGTQMASILLTVNSLSKEFNIPIDSSKWWLWTTKWVAEDKDSSIESLLKMLDFEIGAFYSDFDFSLSEHPALKLYDDGEAKEGVGAGGSLVYALINSLSKTLITREVEGFLI